MVHIFYSRYPTKLCVSFGPTSMERLASAMVSKRASMRGNALVQLQLGS
jgi:hypothetical protein